MLSKWLPKMRLRIGASNAEGEAPPAEVCQMTPLMRSAPLRVQKSQFQKCYTATASALMGLFGVALELCTLGPENQVAVHVDHAQDTQNAALVSRQSSRGCSVVALNCPAALVRILLDPLGIDG